MYITQLTVLLFMFSAAKISIRVISIVRMRKRGCLERSQLLNNTAQIYTHFHLIPQSSLLVLNGFGGKILRWFNA